MPQAKPTLRVKVWVERKTERDLLQSQEDTTKEKNNLQGPLDCVSFFPGMRAEVLSLRLKGNFEVRVRVERKRKPPFFSVTKSVSNLVTC